MIGRPRVKICGITRYEDAELAVELGADAVGFVLWPESPRVVNAFQARSICQALPPFVTRVGVFVNTPPASVVADAAMIGLDVVQLHGEERIGDYRDIPFRLLKAVTLDDADSVEQAAALPPNAMPLIEGQAGAKRGGAGREGNWELAARLAARRPSVLAGGLTDANVALAIRRVRPWAVDVSSGVESAPGIKSPERLRAFFAAVAGWNAEDQ